MEQKYGIAVMYSGNTGFFKSANKAGASVF